MLPKTMGREPLIDNGFGVEDVKVFGVDFLYLASWPSTRGILATELSSGAAWLKYTLVTFCSSLLSYKLKQVGFSKK